MQRQQTRAKRRERQKGVKVGRTAGWLAKGKQSDGRSNIHRKKRTIISMERKAKKDGKDRSTKASSVSCHTMEQQVRLSLSSSPYHHHNKSITNANESTPKNTTTTSSQQEGEGSKGSKGVIEEQNQKSFEQQQQEQEEEDMMLGTPMPE